jgi:N-acetyl-gamma-glutamyl-phosphate reductase
MTARVFIDGEAGTTGLGIRERLAHVPGVTVVSIDPDKRKDPEARKAMMASVDAVVLCLPDDAAKESTALAASLGDQAPRLLDASTAHRVDPNWVYGFAEMTEGQADLIRNAKRVSNPGCYPTGTIALLRPLIEAGILPADHPITINAVSGYSGGGKSMIEKHESGEAPNFEIYGLGLEHKHVPEIETYSKLKTRPMFVPSVGHYHQGMLVSVPLHLGVLPGAPRTTDLVHVLRKHFEGSDLISVAGEGDAALASGKIEPEALNNTDKMELRVFGNDKRGHAVLVARLDNLGKGASGAAVQNLKLMLGLQ